MTLYVETIGSGHPIVLFHGWGFDHQIWLTLAQKLKTNYEIYLVDLPGSGSSSLMSWNDFKTALVHKLPESFSLLGWSLGGLFATRLALELPKRIKTLINISSSPYFLKKNRWPGIEASEFNHLISQMVQDPQKTLWNFLDFHSLFPENVPHVFSSNFSASKANHLIEQLKIFSTWDLREALGTLKLPTYYLFGRYDRIVPRTTLPIMKKKYPQFHYALFEQSTHIMFLSHEKEFIDFLKRCPL